MVQAGLPCQKSPGTARPELFPPIWLPETDKTPFAREDQAKKTGPDACRKNSFHQ
jgi:hypothetical protein